jgi:hypothetical protein
VRVPDKPSGNDEREDQKIEPPVSYCFAMVKSLLLQYFIFLMIASNSGPKGWLSAAR